MVTDVRPEQLLKALSPMLVTLLGISILVKPVHPEKAPPAILSTPSGIMYVPEYEGGKYAKTWEVYTGVVRFVQPEKAEPPMLVTLLGIVILVRSVQPEKALRPMLVTLLGIVTDVKLEQL